MASLSGGSGAPETTLAARLEARFASCWCDPGRFSGDENVDWRQEDCPLHGSSLAKHMAEAALDLLAPARSAMPAALAHPGTDPDGEGL